MNADNLPGRNAPKPLMTVKDYRKWRNKIQNELDSFEAKGGNYIILALPPCGENILNRSSLSFSTKHAEIFTSSVISECQALNLLNLHYRHSRLQNILHPVYSSNNSTLNLNFSTLARLIASSNASTDTSIPVDNATRNRGSDTFDENLESHTSVPSDVNLPIETVLSRHPVLAREDFKVLGVDSSVDDLLRGLYLILTAIGHESTKETTVKWIQVIREIYRAKSYPNYKSWRTNGNGNEGDASMSVTSDSESTNSVERPCFWPSTVPYKESGHLNCREKALLIMSIFAKMPNTDDLMKIARRHQPFQDQPVRLLLLERFEVMARYPQIKGFDFHAIDPSTLPQRKQYRNLFSVSSQETVNVSTSTAIEIHHDNSLNTNTVSDSNSVTDNIASTQTVSTPANSLSPVLCSDSDIADTSILSSNVDARDEAGSISMANVMDASNHIADGENIDNGNIFPSISVVHINGEGGPDNGGQSDDRSMSSGAERISKRRRRNVEVGMLNVERRTQRRVRINTRYSRVQELGFLQRRLE